MDRDHEWQGPAVPETVRTLRQAVTDFGRAYGLTGSELDDLRACVTEAVTNAVVHAFRDGRPPGTVRVIARAREHEVILAVSDDGIGFGRRTDSPGLGLGIPTIAAMAKSMSIGVSPTGGTEIRMTFSRSAAPVRGQPVRVWDHVHCHCAPLIAQSSHQLT